MPLCTCHWEKSNLSYSIKPLLPKSQTLPYEDTAYGVTYIKTNRKKKSYVVICHLILLSIHSPVQCLPSIFISTLSGVRLHAEFENFPYSAHTYTHTHTLQNKSLYMLADITSMLFYHFSRRFQFLPCCVGCHSCGWLETVKAVSESDFRVFSNLMPKDFASI